MTDRLLLIMYVGWVEVELIKPCFMGRKYMEISGVCQGEKDMCNIVVRFRPLKKSVTKNINY
jgi:hypothetical protein